MNYLNLTPGFDMFELPSYDPALIKFESFTFPGGEPHIKIVEFNPTSLKRLQVIITQRISTFADVGLLMVAVNAIRNYEFKQDVSVQIHLILPYFPGARQDSVMNPGEAFTLEVYADTINAMKFVTVTVFDPHSIVAQALIKNCRPNNNHLFVAESFARMGIKHYNFIIPDAGAEKKVHKLIPHLEKEGLFDPKTCKIIQCSKIRDTSTGELTGFKVHAEDLGGFPCIVVDDICDGGGTFIGLAEELKKKNSGPRHLVVSHGIFSKGFVKLSKYYTSIYTTNSWVNESYSMEIPRIERKSEIVTIIPIELQ